MDREETVVGNVAYTMASCVVSGKDGDKPSFAGSTTKIGNATSKLRKRTPQNPAQRENSSSVK